MVGGPSDTQDGLLGARRAQACAVPNDRCGVVLDDMMAGPATPDGWAMQAMPANGEKKEQIICSFLAASLGVRSAKERLNRPLQAYFRWALTSLVSSNIETWSLSKMGRSFASALMLRRLLGSWRSCFLM